MLLALLLMGFVSAALAADDAPAVRSIATVEPRAFGYFLGDAVRREVLLDLKPGAKLERGTLPRPRPVNYWLELRSVDVDESAASGGTRVRIKLSYQAFYSALDPRQLEIPGFVLSIVSETGSEQARVPPFHFMVSPLREIFPGAESDAKGITLRPDLLPQRVSTAHARTAIVIAAPIGLVALILLAMHYAWWPFHRRPGRPFTEAARFLRSNSDSLIGDGGYRAALLKMHRAFDRAAGHRVLPDDLGDFLKSHPQFAALSGDIGRLFGASRAAFYANDVSNARAQMPIEEMTELGARLGAIERSTP